MYIEYTKQKNLLLTFLVGCVRAPGGEHGGPFGDPFRGKPLSLTAEGFFDSESPSAFFSAARCAMHGFKYVLCAKQRRQLKKIGGMINA